MDPLRKVVRGERREPSAALHNATVEAVRQLQRSRDGGGLAPIFEGAQVLVRNSSGSAVRQFGVLAIDGVVYEPVPDNLLGGAPFVLEGRAPSPARRNFVVLQTPLAAGAIGPAVVHGVTAALLNVPSGSESLHFAEPSGEVLQPVESGQAEIVWRAGGTGEQQSVVRLCNSPSTGAGAVFLAIVVSPSVNGSTSSSYTVNIYGSTFASLDEPPAILAAVALQSPAVDRFFLGEVVFVVRNGDGWSIAKLLSLPKAYEVAPEQIDIRLRSVSSTSDVNSVSNFLVDLHDLLDWFDGGATTTSGYVLFTFGAYAGAALVSTSLSVPVKRVSGQHASVVAIASSLTACWELHIPNRPLVLSSSQDSNAVGTAPVSVLGNGRVYFTTPPYYIKNPPVTGITIDVSEILFSCVLQHVFASDTYGLWGSLGLPSIPGAVNSSWILLGAFVAQIQADYDFVAPGNPPSNRQDPNVVAAKPVPRSDASWLGTIPVVSAVELIDSTLTVS